MPKKPVAKPAPEPDKNEEFSLTVRMPPALAEAIRQRASALTALGKGRWSGNLVIVDALQKAAEQWKLEGDKPSV